MILVQIAVLRQDEQAALAEVDRRRRRSPAAAQDENSSRTDQIADHGPVGQASVNAGESTTERAAARGSSDGAVNDDDDDGGAASVSALLKYGRAAGFVTGNGRSPPEALAPWLDERLLDKNIPPLVRFGLRPEHASLVIETMRETRQEGVAANFRAGVGGWRELNDDTISAIVAAEAVPPRKEAAMTHDKDGGASTGVAGGRADTEGQIGQVRTGPWQNKRRR